MKGNRGRFAAEFVLASALWASIAVGAELLPASGELLFLPFSGDGRQLVVIPLGEAAYLDPDVQQLAVPVETRSNFSVRTSRSAPPAVEGELLLAGGFHLIGPGGERKAESLILRPAGDPSEGGLGAFDLVDAATGEIVFLGEAADAMFQPASLVISSSDVHLSPRWARSLGIADTKRSIGSITVRIRLTTRDGTPITESTPTGSLAGTARNPDVIVAVIHTTANSYGSENGISAFSFGTTSCNIGTDPALWIANTNEHPVIAQNVFRLKNNRFEQIGQAWLKHGFAALSQSQCGDCQNPGTTSLLGVGCSDPYSAQLNGFQSNLGPKWEVNAHTGVFPYPFTNDPPLTGSIIQRRVQIHNEDIDPALNAGAVYFVEAQYVLSDDAQAGNGNNNASYRRINFLPGDATRPFIVQVDASLGQRTRQQKPAVWAWQEMDPDVVITEIQVPGEGLFILGAKAWPLGDGFWAYEYALQNLNSHRSCGSFTVPLRTGDTPRAVGFHDVDYHSGDPVDGVDWTWSLGNQSITWSTVPYAPEVDTSANALRWGTLYNFRFESSSAPDAATVTLGLFRPGFPAEVTARTIGPALDIFDCNGNGIDDVCDINCGALNCTQPCGGSLDCDANSIPDECQADCNGNGQADACDLGMGISQDCNGNTVPDECEPDCDGDGIIDDCDPPTDCDGDGIDDCHDLCKCTSGAGACVCPPTGLCCWDAGTICIPDFPRDACIESGGVPECTASPCRAGCLPSEANGDMDRDGDRDLWDLCELWRCFTGDVNDPGYTPPPESCAAIFDFDADNDIDLSDHARFLDFRSGPDNIGSGP